MTKFIVKIFINSTGIDYFFCYLLVFIEADVKIAVKFYIYAVKQLFYNSVIATNGYALIAIVKIVVIICITNRQAFNYKSRQFCTFSAPLFFGVAFNKFGINIYTKLIACSSKFCGSTVITFLCSFMICSASCGVLMPNILLKVFMLKGKLYISSL